MLSLHLVILFMTFVLPCTPVSRQVCCVSVMTLALVVVVDSVVVLIIEALPIYPVVVMLVRFTVTVISPTSKRTIFPVYKSFCPQVRGQFSPCTSHFAHNHVGYSHFAYTYESFRPHSPLSFYRERKKK